MAKKRVDIEVEVETLAWAASEAVKLGISRRQYLSRIIERKYIKEYGKVIIGGRAKQSLTPEECISTQTFKSDE